MAVLEDLQVFAEVYATVSDEFWNEAADFKLQILEKLKVDTSVEYHENPDTKLCIIRGNMQQLFEAQKCMISYLKRVKTNAPFTNFDVDNFRYNLDLITVARSSHEKNGSRFEDKSVMCDLLKENCIPANSFINNNSSAAAALTVIEKYKSRQKKSVGHNTALITKNANKQKLLKLRRSKPTPLMAKDLVCNQGGCCNEQVNKIEDPVLDPNELPVVEKTYRNDEEIIEKGSGGRKTEHSQKFKFSCKRCSFKSNRESHLIKHTRIHEKVNTLYNCDKCGFTTIRLSHLRRHTITHSQVVYNCDFCSYKSNEVKLLARHVKVKHTNDDNSPISSEEILICSYCTYKTTKPYFYQRHLRVHCVDKKQANVVAYQCDKCDYKTNRREHYMRHINDVHMNRRPFLCDFCGKAFKRPDALKQHKQTHGEPVEDVPNSIYKCNICQKKCRSHFSLREHLAVHSNERAFLCEICGASFKTRSVQRKHVITIHKNPRSYMCHSCERRFNTNYALRRHLRLHTKINDEDLPVEDQMTMANDVSSIVELGEMEGNCADNNEKDVEDYLMSAGNNDEAILSEIIEEEMNQIEIKLDDVTGGLESVSQHEIIDKSSCSTLLYLPNNICDIVLI